VDATIIASASKGDGEARWVKHRNRTSGHDFKARVGADADADIDQPPSGGPGGILVGDDGRACS
jgi:IS5 family transposase